MESRLKERLTGAAILVALIVLVVPEMFHGPHSVVAAGAAAPAEGPPIRSYTIDLTDSAAHPSPLQATPSPAQNSTAAPPAGPATPSAVPTVRTVPPVPPVALVPPVRTAPTAAVARAARVAAAAAALPAADAAPPAHAAPAGWSVQLGLFAKDGNAQRLMRTARAKGFSTRISRTDPRGLYRVWIAGLADRAAAEQMSRKLHAAGLPAAIMRPR